MNSTIKAAIASAVVFTVIIVAFLVLRTTEDAPPPPAGTPDRDLGQALETPEADDGSSEPGTMIQKIEVGEVKVTVRITEKSSSRSLGQSRLTVYKASEGDHSGDKVWDSSRGGSDGVFTFAVRPGSYVFHAQCKGYTGERRVATVIKDQAEEIVFALERGNSISGRVVDGNGRGVAGAQVMALKEFAAPDADMEEILMMLVKLEEMTETVYSETTSAEDGSYVLDGLERHWFTVRAIAPDYTPGEVKQVPAPREKVNVRMEPGIVVTGAVVDASGTGIPDATIKAYRESGSKAMFQVILDKSRPPIDVATSDARGAFEFTTLGSGVFNFRVEAPGYQPTTEMKREIASAAELRFELEGGLTISGIVLGPENEPVAGAKIRHQRVGGNSVRPDIANISFDDDSVVSDDSGLFTVDTLAEGEYSLMVYHLDYQTLRRKGVRTESGELTLQMSYGGRIKGFVVNDDGTPIVGARVSASDLADFSKEAVTEEDGSYILSGLQTGRRALSVTATADGYARERRDIKGLADRELEENFELQPTGSVTGTVVTSANDPISGAMVQIKKSHKNGSVDYTVGHGQTDENGRYSITGVEAGEEMWVRVKHRGFLPAASEAMTMDVGTEVEVPPIALDLGGSVAGRVVGPDGLAVSGCAVTVRFEGQTDNTMSMNPSTTTDDKGAFRLQGLESGTLDVLAKPVDLLEKEVPGIVVKEGEVVSGIVVELEQGNSISGRVIDDGGAPVNGATVLARDYSRGATERSTRTRPDGRFTIKKLTAEDNVEFEVTHEDYVDYLSDEVPVGSAGLEIVLDRMGRVSGIVTDGNGAPVAAFSVQPQPVAKSKNRKRLPAKTFNAPDGRFEYKGIPNGVYTVQVRSPVYSAATISNVEVESGTVSDLGEIVLPAGGAVSGRVVDASTGQAVFGARVSIVQGGRFLSPGSASGARSKSSQTTDTNGSFAFSGLKGGKLTLRIQHNDYVQTRVSTNPDEQASRELEIALDPGGEIVGDVLDGDGKPRANTTVYLVGPDTSDNQSVKTDRDGKFSFQRVRAGHYTVRAHEFTKGTNAAEQAGVELDVESGEVGEVLLQLP